MKYLHFYVDRDRAPSHRPCLSVRRVHLARYAKQLRIPKLDLLKPSKEAGPDSQSGLSFSWPFWRRCSDGSAASDASRRAANVKMTDYGTCSRARPTRALHSQMTRRQSSSIITLTPDGPGIHPDPDISGRLPVTDPHVNHHLAIRPLADTQQQGYTRVSSSPY